MPARVVRAPTPPRDHDSQVEGRRTITKLFKDEHEPIQILIVALTDAVELEICVGSTLRKRCRFLTDASAWAHAKRLRSKLEARGYLDRRQPRRWSVNLPSPTE